MDAVGRSLTLLILVWQDVGDLLDLKFLQNLKAGGRERGERERREEGERD